MTERASTEVVFWHLIFQRHQTKHELEKRSHHGIGPFEPWAGKALQGR